jgi:hypothetical protein
LHTFLEQQTVLHKDHREPYQAFAARVLAERRSSWLMWSMVGWLDVDSLKKEKRFIKLMTDSIPLQLLPSASKVGEWRSFFIPTRHAR